MDLKELRDDKFVNDWFITLSVKDSTRERYLDAIKLFTNMTGKTPEALILEAEADIKSGKLMRERNVRNHLLRFRAMLNEKVNSRVFAPSTAELRWYAIKSFYKAFEIDLPRNIQNGDNHPKQENMNLKFNKEDIRKMLIYCRNVRDRAIILSMKSSGMAKQEIIDLTYGQFREGYDRETKVTTIFARRKKVGADFITFIDPEGSEAVIEYLREAMRINNDGSFDRNYDKLPLFTLSRGDMGKLTDVTFMYIFRNIAMKMHRHEPTKRGQPLKYNPLRSHNLRKFFNTTLKNNGFNGDIVEFMMGHVGDRTKSTYYLHDVEKLKEQYLMHMPALAINANGMNTELVKENREQRLKIEQYKSEVDKLKARLKELEGKDMTERENVQSLLEDLKQLNEKAKAIATK